MIRCILTVHLFLAALTVASAEKLKDGHHRAKEEDRFADPCSAVRYEHDIAIDQQTLMSSVAPNRDEHGRDRRAATAFNSNLWPHGVVPYQFDSKSAYTFFHKAVILKAIRHWESRTCLTFIPKRSSDRNYVSFYKGSCGCCSYVGVGGGRQGISIGSNCFTVGIVVHEIGHAIGFWHEHTRPDRDKHIDILWENIKPEETHNFDKQSAYKIDSHGEPYDYASIMHYSSTTFSKNQRLKTIQPRKLSVLIGQRNQLSSGDIKQTNKLYKCPACGSILIQRSGSFSPPKNSTSNTCIWRIRAEKGYYISLQIKTSELGKIVDDRCQLPYVEVKNYVTSRETNRYCAQAETHIVESSDSQLYVSYTRDANNPDKTFTASYTTSCSKNFTSAVGILQSPLFPNSYPASGQCQWVITGQSKINVSFAAFGMESHGNCGYDYLELRDGPDISSTLLKRLCGSSHPAPLSTTGNQLFIRFKSDRSVQKLGFSMRWESDADECAKDNGGCDHNCINFVGSYKCTCRLGYRLASEGQRCLRDCGGVLTGLSGVITSPNYPRYYVDNKLCEWQIRLPNNANVILSVTEFDVETGGSQCVYDRVEIYNGSAPLPIGKYCNGHEMPKNTNLGNIVRIVFRTDRSTVRRGFKFTYRSKGVDKCKNKNGGCQMNCINKLEGHVCNCSSGYRLNLDGRTCTVTDPCLVNNGGCQIICRTKAGGHECGCPSGYKLNSDGRTCTVTNPCVVSNGGCQMICRHSPPLSHACSCLEGYKLKSDGRSCSDIDECAQGEHSCDYSCINTAGSFHCGCPSGYQTLSPNGTSCFDIDECASSQLNTCSQKCTNNKGGFECSCYPGHKMNKKRICKRINYCKSSRCEHRCRNLETSYRCECYDGYNLTSDGEHCRDYNECAAPDTGGCSHICINYEGGYNCTCPSSGYVLRKDRKSCYRCYGRMSSTANMLGLPSHSVVTEKGAECLWYLRVDPGQRIKITFTRVPTDDCNTTQFRVVNPNHQICRSRGSPSVVVSKRNEVKILFQSEQAYQQLTGYFLAHYSSICGGSLEVTLLTKKMYSHNGEGKRNYPPGSNCTWTLRAADEKYVIHVESDDFQLEESDNCKSDYVLIDNNRYCGHQSFISYKSASPVVVIKFVSDADKEDGGFRIKYYAKEETNVVGTSDSN